MFETYSVLARWLELCDDEHHVTNNDSNTGTIHSSSSLLLLTHILLFQCVYMQRRAVSSSAMPRNTRAMRHFRWKHRSLCRLHVVLAPKHKLLIPLTAVVRLVWFCFWPVFLLVIAIEIGGWGVSLRRRSIDGASMTPWQVWLVTMLLCTLDNIFFLKKKNRWHAAGYAIDANTVTSRAIANDAPQRSASCRLHQLGPADRRGARPPTRRPPAPPLCARWRHSSQSNRL